MIDFSSFMSLLVGSGHSVEPLFMEIGLIIVIATMLGFTLKMLKQPLIPAYVLAGVILGPYGLKIITNQDVVTTLSEMGIAFLLFVVGIEMDFKRLKSIGLIAGIGGTLQIFVLSLCGWLLALTLGFGATEAIYGGIIVAFSSTMVAIKLLSDKNELDTLHGRIIIGFLLIEDIFAILVILTITNINNIAQVGLLPVIGILALKIIIILMFSIIMGKYIFPHLFKLAAESTEILFLVSITVCFLFGFLAGSIGLSVAIGAFIGGVSIAHLPYKYEIMGKIKALRVFFITIFFAALGMKLNVTYLSVILVPLIVFVIFISLVKPFITSIICSFFGYKRRTSLLTSMSIAQTSEFSLIIITLATAPTIKHLSGDSMLPTLAILLSIITMVITSYTIKFDTNIYDKIKNIFKFLDKIGSGNREIDMFSFKDKHEIIMIGYDRIGYNILNTLHKKKKKVLIIDFNPEIVRALIQKGVDCIYGDISDSEILARINIKDAEMIISTAPELHDNMTILNYLKKHNTKGEIFVTASKVDDALELYSHGADYVILPHFLGGHHVSVMLEEETLNLDRMLKRKLDHIKELEHRKSIGHEHPTHQRVRHTK